MGREIRRVPPISKWHHPTVGEILADRDSQYYTQAARMNNRDPGEYISLYDANYDDAAKNFIDGFLSWHGENGKIESAYSKYYWEYDNPPDEAYYRDYKDEDATWYQVYQTVSEGCPVSPAFETPEELIDYLVANGDDWDKHRGVNTYSNREATTRFVKEEMSVPSMIFNAATGEIKTGVEILQATS